MSTTDIIKDTLSSHFPGTSEASWKRRSKKKTSRGVERVFENVDAGNTATVIEDAYGNITIDGVSDASQTIAEKVVPKPKAAKKSAVSRNNKKVDTVSIRKQMVIGSVWVFTEDCEIIQWVSNPERNELINKRHPRGGYGRDPEVMALDSHVERHVATIPAGTRFTVIGKSQNSEHGWGTSDPKFSNGLRFPVTFDKDNSVIHHMPLKEKGMWNRGHNPLHYWRGSDDNDVTLPFMKIAAYIAPETIPETLVYVLRDTATGELFGGWKDEKYTERYSNYDGTFRTYHGKRADVGNPKMVTKLSSAKKYKTLSAVKASIREFTGYNDGLDDRGLESGAYYVQGGKKAMDLPPTWEVVEFDKVSGVEKGTHDVQAWLKELYRLRSLTANVGPAVRAVYKEVEGDMNYDTVIVFEKRSRGVSTWGTGAPEHWDEAEQFEDASDGGIKALEAIKKAASKMSNKTVRKKTNTAVAFACKLSDAFIAKMSIDEIAAEVKVKMYNLNTLEEIVDNG